MARAPRLTYHATAFRLLGTDPAASATALPQIEAAEAKAGRPLPPAVREWYLIDRAETLTFDEPNVWPRLPTLKDYLAGFVKAAKGKTPKPSAGFELDAEHGTGIEIGTAGDDPPVRASDPELADEDLDLGRFTEYVLRAVWEASGANWYLAAVDRGWVVKRKHHHQAAVAGPPHLDFLTEYLTPLAAEVNKGGSDGEPDEHTYRYYGPSGRVEVSAAGDAMAGVVPADWVAKARSEDALFGLYAMLRPMHGYTLRLWAPKDDKGFAARFQKRFPGVPVQG